MKKVLFCIQTMVLGGVEKELITILKRFNTTKYDITVLLLYRDNDDIISQIPDYVKVVSIDIDKQYYCSGLIQLCFGRIKRGKFLEAISLITKKTFGIGMTHSNTDISAISSPKDEFDIAVCYHIHSPLALRYVAEKIYAKKKIAWIHNDFYASRYRANKLMCFLNQYDEVVAVSDKVRKEFCELCNGYVGKVFTVHNILDDEEIIRKSQSNIEDTDFLSESKVKILTIGRFTEQKGIDNAIRCGLILKENNMPFHWYLIGYGTEEKLYRELIEEYDLSGCFSILGKKDNPYPYIKNCDIYVQPSRHEAYSIVMLEAKLLERPIVCTNFDGADEQIVSGKNGYIVPLNDNTALTNAIVRLINNKEERERLSLELEKESFDDGWESIESHFYN